MFEGEGFLTRGCKSAKVLTAKISAREKSYGSYLYMHLSKEVERRMGWQRDDLVQLILDEERDLIVLKRFFRVSEAVVTPSPLFNQLGNGFDNRRLRM